VDLSLICGTRTDKPYVIINSRIFERNLMELGALTSVSYNRASVTCVEFYKIRASRIALTSSIFRFEIVEPHAAPRST